MNPPSEMRKPIHWKKSDLALLGKIPDHLVAQRLSCNMATVRRKRLELGIQASRPQIRYTWTDKTIAMLGTMSDDALAAKLQVTQKIIIRKRRELGIESHAWSQGVWRTWKPREIKLLGTMTDQQVAEKLGIPHHCVYNHRRHLGIPAFAPIRRRRPVKKAGDWTAREIAMLGTMTDARVAEKLGLGLAVVHRMRNQLGIPPKRGDTKWTGKRLALLGTMPDRQLAEKLGITKQAVSEKRIKLGISRVPAKPRKRSADFQSAHTDCRKSHHPRPSAVQNGSRNSRSPQARRQSP